MSEAGENFGLVDNRLSLIDVSFEDDSLLCASSPSRDFKFSDDLMDNGSVQFLNLLDSQNMKTSVNCFEVGVHVPRPLESSEPEEKTKHEKYNLRKSLAWDSAFFTSAGVLEPEELSSMIGGAEKSGKGVLPGIKEDLERSTDSLSTLASDNLTTENLEADLFGDIRASIQKSSKSSSVANHTSRVGSQTTAGQAKQCKYAATFTPSIGQREMRFQFAFTH